MPSLQAYLWLAGGVPKTIDDPLGVRVRFAITTETSSGVSRRIPAVPEGAAPSLGCKQKDVSRRSARVWQKRSWGMPVDAILDRAPAARGNVAPS